MRAELKDEEEGNKEEESESPLDKAIRKARAKAEIKRLTSGVDPIVDRDSELKKVIGGISCGLGANSAEAEAERKVSRLETKLSRSISCGDFSAAAATRDEMDRMHIDDCGYVLQANSLFYKALSEKDLETMTSLWLQSDCVQCIHPSHKPLVGYKSVMDSWKAMFDSKDRAFQVNTMEPSNVRLSVKGCTAWLTCDEEVYAPKFVRGIGKSKELLRKMMATNIFRKIDTKWFLVHHHATWHSDSQTHKKTLPASNNNLSSLLSNDISPNNNNNPPVRRVFMGSLSDLLNAGLSDLLSSADKSNDSHSKTVIHLNALNDDDSDDDQDEDESDDINSSSRHWTKLPSLTDDQHHHKSSPSSSLPKDALRQNCISALRKLCHQGSISQKQKRLLLTDIITCSAKGEFSLVEVAYELLCTEGDDKDAAEEDFADQCRVFAANIEDST